MNVLTVVFSMMMLIAIMTYGRFAAFLNFSALQAEYHHYMTETRLLAYQEAQLKIYEELKSKDPSADPEVPVTSPSVPAKAHPSPQEKESPKPSKEKLNSCVSLNLFFNKQEREKHLQEFQLTKGLLKRLIVSLYRKQDFYQEMLRKRPDFVDQIFQHLMEAGDQEKSLLKIKTSDAISNLDLKDLELQEVYYKMLKGSREKTHEKDEFLLKEGYPSLLSFVKLHKGNKISIYLASGELLLAIYEDPNVVEDILSSRAALYLATQRTQGPDSEQASKSFEEKFSGLSYLGDEESVLLEFRISGSDPREYQ